MTDLSTRDRLVPLGELDQFHVAPGYPDIRGWTLYGDDDAHLGDVDELLVDTTVKKARWLVASVADGVLHLGRKSVVIPIGRARLDEASRRVYLDGVTATELAKFRAYDRAHLDDVAFYGTADARPSGTADDDARRFFGQRGGSDDFVVYREERVILTDTDTPRSTDVQGDVGTPANADVDVPAWDKEKEPV